jgi:hypothetical protein
MEEPDMLHGIASEDSHHYRQFKAATDHDLGCKLRVLLLIFLGDKLVDV